MQKNKCQDSPLEAKNSKCVNRDRVLLSGEGISQGLARGRAFLYTDILTRHLQTRSINSDDIGGEKSRIKRAMDQAMDDLGEQKRIVLNQSDQFNAAIFDFHQEILKDKQLNIDLAEELESELINAEIVVKNVFRKLSDHLRLSDNRTVCSKADDIDDLSRRILRILIGYESNILEMLPSDSIIVARRLLPSDTVHLKRECLKGIVVEEGSNHSHSALLARAFGITAIANIKNLAETIQNGDQLLLDGKRGTIIVNPKEEDIQDFESKKKIFSTGQDKTRGNAKEPAVTKCGQQVKIYANAYFPEDFKISQINGCDGIGLFRMEQLYMSFKALPRENEIFKQLNETFKDFPDKLITVRLLDIGGDKKLPYLNMKQEENPFLGLRGIRFLLKNKDILRTQIKAILRLSQLYPVRLMVPMVTLVEEIQQVRVVIDECRDELSGKTDVRFSDIPFGIMVETPAAVLSAQSMAEHVDFFSIGTNDLLQYVMAAGRENADVSHYYEKGVDLIFNLIKGIAGICQEQGVELNVCGELAGDLKQTEQLLRCGVRHLSVSPHRIPDLKQEISKIEVNLG